MPITETDMMDICELRLLYLAYYAPTSERTIDLSGIKDVSYVNYHRDVYDVLKKYFPKMTSSDDAGCLLNSDLNKNVDYIFSLYNRMPLKNSEVFVSSMAEYHGIPYLGAPPNTRAVGEDKHITKMVAAFADVPTAEWKIYDAGSELKPPAFGGPYFIKPRFGATSLEIDEDSIADDWNAAQQRIRYLNEKGYSVILEKQIVGKQYASPMIDNFGDRLILPPVEETSNLKGNVITYNQKRFIDDGLRREVCKDEKIQDTIRRQTERIMNVLGPIDYARLDYIIEEKTGIAYFIELNICCNLGKRSAMVQSARSVDVGYEDLVKNIVFSSLFRNEIIENRYGMLGRP